MKHLLITLTDQSSFNYRLNLKVDHKVLIGVKILLTDSHKIKTIANIEITKEDDNLLDDFDVVRDIKSATWALATWSDEAKILEATIYDRHLKNLRKLENIREERNIIAWKRV